MLCKIKKWWYNIKEYIKTYECKINKINGICSLIIINMEWVRGLHGLWCYSEWSINQSTACNSETWKRRVKSAAGESILNTSWRACQRPFQLDKTNSFTTRITFILNTRNQILNRFLCNTIQEINSWNDCKTEVKLYEIEG